MSRLFLQCCIAIALMLTTATRTDAETDVDRHVLVGDVDVPLPPPTLDGNETRGEMQSKLEPLLRGLPFRQFARESVVAPVRIYPRYVENEAGERMGHAIHFLFVVHEPLESFSSDRFAQTVFQDGANTREPAGDPATGSNDQTGSEPVSEEMLDEWGIASADPDATFRRLQFDLLEQVSLDLLVRISSISRDGQNRIDLALVDEFANTWKKIDAPDDSGVYSGLGGWVTATNLPQDEAVLIEGRLVFREPQDWFAGSNFLRSKLPLVLQEAARDLRRELKRKRPAD